MSEACGRRRLVKLVFATGASGNLRGFLEEAVHVSYNYRVTDRFVCHAAFPEGGPVDEIDAYQAAAETAWSNYIKEQKIRRWSDFYGNPEDELIPYRRHASTLQVAPELLWALKNPQAAKLPELSNWVLGKECLEKWELLELELRHLESIKRVSSSADGQAKRLNTWENASEKQKKAAEELIEVERKEVPEKQDAEKELKDKARQAFENFPELKWAGTPTVPTKRKTLEDHYGNSEVEWALVTANAEIPKHLRECRAAKTALLKRKTREADKAFEELYANDTSPIKLVERAEETTKEAHAEEGCWKTDKAKDDLRAAEDKMWECVKGAKDAWEKARKAAESAKNASQRAREAAESSKNALQRAREAAQSAPSVKKSNAPAIGNHAAAESNAPGYDQTDSRSGLTQELRSVVPSNDEEEVQKKDELQTAKKSALSRSTNTTASKSLASKSSTFPCEPTREMILGIPLLGFIVYAIWKAIRPVPSKNLMAKSAVKNKVKSGAAPVTDRDESAVMVEATGMPKTSHEEGGLCSQLV